MWQGKKGIVITLIIGLIIGYVAGSSWGKSDAPSKNNQNQSGLTIENDGLSQVGGSGLITVKDQPAGQQVVIDSVQTDELTWVAVREDNNGQPGNILGAALLSLAGESADVMVDLLVPSSPMTKYHVTLYADNGDRFFDNKTDELVSDETGEIIHAVFNTL